MTRGTHQVAAFAGALGVLALAQPVLIAAPDSGLPPLVAQAARPLGLPAASAYPWPAAVAYLVVALLGGVAPDLDKPRGLWARLVADVALGGHRHLSHSLLGVGLIATLAGVALAIVAPLFSFPVGLLWLGFVAGYLSHLVMDTLTVDGVPWLYPWRVYVGLPLKGIRIRTGGWAEQLVVVPALLTLIGWLGYRAGYLLISLWR